MKHQSTLVAALVSLLSTIAFAQEGDNGYYEPDTGNFTSPEPLYDSDGNRTVTPSEWNGGYPYRPTNSDESSGNSSDPPSNYDSTYGSGVAK